MKKIKLLAFAAIAAFVTVSATAQSTNIVNQLTNPPPDITIGNTGLSVQGLYDTFIESTNAAFTAAYARGLTGNKNVAGGIYTYNVQQNVGIMLGYDRLWGNHQQENNVLKGGLALQAQLAPFKNFGVTNFIVTPFASYLVATVANGPQSGDLGAVEVAGCDYDWLINNNLKIHTGVFYENRSGQGYFNGNYGGGELSVSYGW